MRVEAEVLATDAARNLVGKFWGDVDEVVEADLTIAEVARGGLLGEELEAVVLADNGEVLGEVEAADGLRGDESEGDDFVALQVFGVERFVGAVGDGREDGVVVGVFGEGVATNEFAVVDVDAFAGGI